MSAQHLSTAPMFVPSQEKLASMIDDAMRKFDRSVAEYRFDAAVTANRKTFGVREAIEHGCHPKPRDGGLFNF